MTGTRKISAAFSVGWPLAIVCAVAVGVLSVWWGALNQDEGWYLYAAQLVGEGKMPYRDFFFTQGPTMPYVYALFAKLWAPGSWVSGLLGGRCITFLIGLAQTFFAMLLVRRLVRGDAGGRGRPSLPAGEFDVAGGRGRPPLPVRTEGCAELCVFAVLACNLYHVYFTTIPKTYALGGLFLMVGFWALAVGLEKMAGCAAVRGRAALPVGEFGVAGGRGRPPLPVGAVFLSGMLLAFASGTRISLVLVLGVVGVGLLACFRRFRWAFLFFGLGGVLGLGVTYGIFAADPASLKGLLAAQAYHAARGGFDPFFVIGSVSRLARGYAALGVVLFAGGTAGGRGRPPLPAGGTTGGVVGLLLVFSFTAVFLLQLSAPFPYDDYQVPIMPLLAVAIVAWIRPGKGFARMTVLVAGLSSFASPLLQEWATYGQDRFWSVKKEQTELAKLRSAARLVEELDPNGKDILTQDLYLAVETGRHVPSGLEMGPFCYFADLPDDEADALHVMNTKRFEELIARAPCALAAFSGYGFAISVPKTAEVPFGRQTKFWEILKKHYELMATEYRFGQNATTLLVLRRKGGGSAGVVK